MVDEVQIDIFNAKLGGTRVSSGDVVLGGEATHVLQAVVNGRFNVQTIQPRVLGGDEYILPREPALPNGPPSFFLIPVRLGGVCK